MLNALNFILEPVGLEIQKRGSYYQLFKVKHNGSKVGLGYFKTLHEAKVDAKRYLNRHELVKRQCLVVDHQPCYQREDGVLISDYGEVILRPTDETK
jgi:hypothetical protein